MTEEPDSIPEPEAAAKAEREIRPDPVLIYAPDPPAAIITMNRPDRRNAINDEMVAGMHSALDLALDDDEIRAVIITGTGSSFSAGIDLHEVLEKADRSHEEKLADAEGLARLFRRLRSFEKVTIAAVNGPALASGCGLATLCDFTLATGSAKFGFPEVTSGFVPAVVSVYMRGILNEKHLRDLLLTGRTLSSDEAHEIGLVSAVVPADDLLERGRDIARRIEKNAPASIRMTKELLETLPGLEIDHALKAAAETNARMMDSPECREGVRAFIEKRDPVWATEEDESVPEPPAEEPKAAGNGARNGDDPAET